MRVAFVSSMAGEPWGGSEELWSQAALKLVQQGFSVSASVHGREPPHARSLDLEQRGVDVLFRPYQYPRWRRAMHKLSRGDLPLPIAKFRQFLESRDPSLVVFSNGIALPPVELVELCMKVGVPFVTIAQANHDDWWPDDDLARRFRCVLTAASRCYFVSEANWRTLEKQIGVKLLNAEVVRNPFNVPYDASPPWPSVDEKCILRLACVARLHPPSKGQDLLFELLATPPWNARDWNLSLYGEGPNKEVLTRLAQRLGLTERVSFRGHIVDVASVWTENHLLVLPSRYEGMPLSLIEAMLCGRPALVTDAAGNSEVVCDGVNGFVAESPSVAAFTRALEQVWARRSELKSMGEAASHHIRKLVPRDPVGTFVVKLRRLIDSADTCRDAAE